MENSLLMTKPLSTIQNSRSQLGAFTWSLAWRFYRSKANIRVLSFINKLTKFGITLGIAILIMTNSVINGFDKQLHEKFLNLIPQALIFNPQGTPFKDGKTLEQQIANFTNISTVSPVVSKTVLLENGPQKRVLQIFGIDLTRYNQVSSLGNYVQDQGGLNLLLSSSLDPQSKQLLLPKAQLILNKLALHTTNANKDGASGRDNLSHNENTVQGESSSSMESSYSSKNEEKFSEILNSPTIILGRQLAEYLNVDIGDYVRAYVFGGDNSNLEQNQYFIVSAIVDSSGLFDKELALINIYDATGIVGLNDTSCPRPNVDLQGKITANDSSDSKDCIIINAPSLLTPQQIANAFQVRLKDPDDLTILPYQGWTSDESVSYTSWGRIYYNIYNDLPMIKSLLGIGVFFVSLLAGFNIICSILIQIRDKKKTITTLQAIGFANWQVHRVFVKFSFILALHAIILGSIIGILGSYALESLSHWLLASGVEVLSPSTYFIDYLPVAIAWTQILSDAVMLLIVALITACLTSVFANKKQVEVKYLA